MSVGIDDISFFSSGMYLSLSTLAAHNGEDPDKYRVGLGQERMGVPAQDEDVVTLAANAARPLINDNNRDQISTVLFATESSIDQSKAAGVYVHRLLGLGHNCRVVELKQACYSATAAVQMACGLVARKPDSQVLVIASDIARYGLGTPGEATQGCGAVALIVKAKPRLLEVHAESGCYSEDVMDFWRPNYRDTALVDGKYSTIIYLKALRQSWKNYREDGGLAFDQFSRFCYHLPFTKMGEKAHRKLAVTNGVQMNSQPLVTHFRMTAQQARHRIEVEVTGTGKHIRDIQPAQQVTLISLINGQTEQFKLIQRHFRQAHPSPDTSTNSTRQDHADHPDRD